MYSLRLSLYKLEASTFAGDEVFGSLSKLISGLAMYAYTSVLVVMSAVAALEYIPLNAGQDCCYIVCGAPSILQNI